MTVGLAACFGVFVLPLLLPPARVAAISVSNATGFNNKIAAVVIAFCALVVFLISLRLGDKSSEQAGVPDIRPLRRSAWMGAALFAGLYTACFGWLISNSDRRYPVDVDYFIHQMSSSTFFHRQLYTSIEFPYGPLLFYPPILLHTLFRGHLSLQCCYFIVLVLHQVLGVSLLAYLVNYFPMSRSWKIFAMSCFVPFTLQPIFGVNYTLLRFTLPLAVLVFSARQGKVWMTCLLFGLGQMLTLALSPEMGFAFGAGAFCYAALQCWRKGKTWLSAIVVLPIGAGLFLLIVGAPYLRMLSLFAGGVFNFIVEPLPYIVVFLFAAIWFVPRMLAARWTSDQPETVLLGSCFVVSMALVPVALGRADPEHVFFNGVGIFLLAMVALSTAPRWQQTVWGIGTAGTMALGLALVYHLFLPELRSTLYRDIVTFRSSYVINSILNAAGEKRWSASSRDKLDHPVFESFDIATLEKIVDGSPVAAPLEIGPKTELMLAQHGLYRPDAYYFTCAVLDDKAEARKIAELNQAHWALLPTGIEFHVSEDQGLINSVSGMQLHYRQRWTPYEVGLLFNANLKTRWEPVAQIDTYTLYRNRS
ncbi:hypothetical protein [Granulicella arctica]|uniref:hypothetical protein n=1 Tax=Granulicella arctica TaxID=940613 RepID=UPI0021E028BE|nr:hypothetical protein [Granulicella arctica]